MSKILALADAYAAERQRTNIYSDACTEARAALQAEVSEIEKDAELVVLQGKVNKQLIEDLFALREKLAAVEKDAARFRFIETHPDYGACKWDDGQEGVFGWFHVTAAHIDAAIEATK